MLNKILIKIRNLLNKIINEKIDQDINITNWFKNNGDKTHRLNYSITSESIVFDIGGYEGQWASDIYSKYSCIIHVFEPIPEFYNNIKERFQKNNKILVYPFGLGNKTKSVNISVEKDSSSIIKKSSNSINIQLKNIFDFIQENNIKEIDLMKINIEGAEYDLLDYLIAKNMIKFIKNIQVQFHDFEANSKERMDAIKDQLKITHTPTYIYEFVWENWELKNKP
jgi:FkbM family methyltransferase